MTDFDDLSKTHMSVLVLHKQPQNHVAWQGFADKYTPAIVAFCKRVFRVSDNLAEEIAQRVLIKLLDSLRTFQYSPQQSFRNWLKRVVRNALYDYYREQRRLPRTMGNDEEVASFLTSIPERVDAERLVETLALDVYRDLYSEAEPLVRRKLTETQWKAYEMAVAHVPADEISESLGISTANVYQIKTRTKKMFRTIAQGLIAGREIAEELEGRLDA